MRDDLIKRLIKKIFYKENHFTNVDLYNFIKEIDQTSEYRECPYDNDGFPDSVDINSWMNPNLVYFYITFSGQYGPYETQLIGVNKIFSNLHYRIYYRS